MKKFDFEFVTLRKVLYQTEAVSVRLPGVDGPLEIYANHAPFMSLLQPGELDVVIDDAKNKVKVFVVESGVVQVTNNKVTVLANRGVNSGEISPEGAEEQKALIQTALAQKNHGQTKKLLRQKQYLEEQIRVLNRASIESLERGD